MESFSSGADYNITTEKLQTHLQQFTINQERPRASKIFRPCTNQPIDLDVPETHRQSPECKKGEHLCSPFKIQNGFNSLGKRIQNLQST